VKFFDLVHLQAYFVRTLLCLFKIDAAHTAALMDLCAVESGSSTNQMVDTFIAVYSGKRDRFRDSLEDWAAKFNICDFACLQKHKRILLESIAPCVLRDSRIEWLKYFLHPKQQLNMLTDEEIKLRVKANNLLGRKWRKVTTTLFRKVFLCYSYLKI
jgi:hypothetical protein